MEAGRYNDHKCAAFPGAAFTPTGYCIKHSDCQICTPVSIGGRTKFEKLKSCPKCARNNTQYHSLPVNDEKRDYHKETKTNAKKQIHPAELTGVAKTYPSPHDTPFDSKGRCHNHKEVQLATRQLGEWKVLLDSCPLCREQAKAKLAKSEAKKSKEKEIVVHFDEHGFCINHPDIKVAKKKVTGSWKVTNACSQCISKDDTTSVYSKDS
eukprot:CCRYP_008378-RA/>CCRYP_008378-RA protein AED:0.28 eAED:0.28 QI:380/1/0.5/1/1/0.5/2/0/208